MSENNEKTAVEKAAVVDKPDKPEKGDKKKKVKKKKERKHPFGDMVSELKKVTWPTKEDLRTYSACVVLFVAVSAVLLFVMDLGVTALINYISDPETLPSVLAGWFGIGG